MGDFYSILASLCFGEVSFLASLFVKMAGMLEAYCKSQFVSKVVSAGWAMRDVATRMGT